MKFAALALLATTTSATTITINDKLIQDIGENWQKAAFKLQRTLEDLNRQEQKELEPYLRSLEKDVRTMVDIDMRYAQKWGDAADKAAF